jgi:hypothetical protein
MPVYTSNLRLHNALGANELEDALTYLKQGDSLVLKDNLGWTALHVIARNDFVSFFTHPAAQTQCALHALSILTNTNASGETPLDIAAAGRIRILTAFMKVILEAHLPSDQYTKALISALCSSAQSDSDNECFEFLLTHIPSNFDWRAVRNADGDSIARQLLFNASTTNLKSLLQVIGMPLFSQLWMEGDRNDKCNDPLQYCIDIHSQSAGILNQFHAHPLPVAELTGCDSTVPTMLPTDSLVWGNLKI